MTTLSVEEKRSILKRDNIKFPSDRFHSLNLADFAPVPQRTEIWRSRDFLVQVFELGWVVRLTVNRTAIKDDGNWQDGITWDEMQFVKNGVGFQDHDAVEVFPKQNDLVNKANMRHLWIPLGDKAKSLDFIWRNREGSGVSTGKLAEEILAP